jgi:hypothetical protein
MLALRAKDPLHRPRHCFRSVSALKGPQNVASGNARRPLSSAPTLKGLHAFGLGGCDPFRVGRFPEASGPQALPTAR